MSNMTYNVKLNNFSDFDAMLQTNNLIVTLLGAILGFSLSYFSQTIITLPVSPFHISLSLAIVLATASYTRNFASTALVGLVTGIGIISPYGGRVDFIEGYILLIVVLSISMGLFANRLKLVIDWTKTYIILGTLLSIYIIVMAFLAGGFEERYFSKGYNLGAGGDPLGGTNLPLVEIAALVGIILLSLISTLLLKGTVSLSSSSAKNYLLFGYIMIALSLVISVVSLFLFTKTIPHQDMVAIANNPDHLKTINELFSYQATNQQYSIVTAPVNAFSSLAFSVMLYSIGISCTMIGKNKGNMDGMRGGATVIFFAIPTYFLVFFSIGSYYIQNFISPGGYFVAFELLPVYFSMMWAYIFINVIVAYIYYSIISLVFKIK